MRAPLVALTLCAALLFGCAGTGPYEPITGTRYTTPGGQVPTASLCEGESPKLWAVVVGVNFYQDERISDLGGAVNDAWAFYHYLASPNGGSVDAYRRKLLLNHEATYSKVLGALGNFVKEACPQDQIVIYFAGHGAHESDASEEAFLLVHDTDMENMVGTAISMSKLPDFLKWRAGQAGHLLLLVDACHSGNIQFPGKRGVKNATRSRLVAKGLQKVVETKEGWGAISATAPDQLAGEASRACQLGEFNYKGGLFTCRMLEALAGKADLDKDQHISLTELYDHIKTMVAIDTGRQQIPQLSGNLDTAMIVAKAGSGPVRIPQVPEIYLKEEPDKPLRPYIWTTAGLTAAALGTAVFFHLSLNLDTQTFNEKAPTTVSRDDFIGFIEDHDTRQDQVFLTYGIAGGFAALTLFGALWDVLDTPQGREDVYTLPPWFQFGVAPTPQGAQLNLKLTY